MTKSFGAARKKLKKPAGFGFRVRGVWFKVFGFCFLAGVFQSLVRTCGPIIDRAGLNGVYAVNEALWCPKGVGYC